MAIDPNRPLLPLLVGRVARRTYKGPRPRFPAPFTRERQTNLLGPKFNSLRQSLARAAQLDPIELRQDAAALAPESLMVFELRAPLVTFADAVRAVEGLELVAEDDEQLLDEDGGPVDGKYYAVFANQNSLRELLRLWDMWQRGGELEKPFKAWERVFDCLHDLRRWGPADRVTDRNAATIRALAEGAVDANARIHIELELVFRADSTVATNVRQRVRADLASRDIRELSAARYEGFGYDVLLIEVTPQQALAIADRLADGVAGLNDAFRLRPQSIGYGFGGEDRDAAPRIEANPVQGDPIAAIFDGYPLANHPYLANRIIVDDPDNIDGLAVGPRVHGTAMASLVSHGDLLDRLSVGRPVYVRPFLADTHNWPGTSSERSLPNRLLVDDIVRAVQRLKVPVNNQAAVAPSIVVINISFAVPDLVFDGTMSPLARCLDWLSWEYGVLFVVSAGNSTDALATAFQNEAEFIGATNDARTEATLTALRDVQSDQQLLSPAEAINALTVGSYHSDNVNERPSIGPSHDPLPSGIFPNVHSRMGLGFARSAKPDLIAPGGRLRVQLQPAQTPIALSRGSQPSRFGGLRVAGLIDAANGPQLSWSGATSGAAALATNTAHLIYDALQTAYGNRFEQLSGAHKALLLKSLLLHRAKWPLESVELVERVFGRGQQRHFSKRRADVVRLFGLGTLDRDEALSCASNRATAWAVDSIASNRGLTFRLPMPDCLRLQRSIKALSATVCWFTPTTPGRQTYRVAKLRIDEGEAGFADDLRRVGTPNPSKGQLDPKAMQRGTVFHRRWEGKALATFADNFDLHIKVSRMIDNSGVRVPFALAVTLEAEDDLPIYDEVLARIDIALRPRLPAVVRA